MGLYERYEQWIDRVANRFQRFKRDDTSGSPQEPEEEPEKPFIEHEPINWRRVWRILFGLSGCLLRIFIVSVAIMLLIVILLFRAGYATAGIVFMFLFAGPIFLMCWYIRKKWRDWQDPAIAINKALEELPDDLKDSVSPFRNAFTLPKFGGLDRGYHPYVLDAVFSSGWLPSYDYYVSPVPSTIDLKPFLYETVWQEQEGGESQFADSISKGISVAMQRRLEFKASLEFHDFLFEHWADKRNTMECDMTCCFTISDNTSVTPNKMEEFWTSLQGLTKPVSFEIVADGKSGRIIFQLLCHEEDKVMIAGMLSAFFPDINKDGDDTDYLTYRFGDNLLSDMVDYRYRGVQAGLGLHCTQLIRTFTSFDPDPLTSLVTGMGDFLDCEGSEKAMTVSQQLIYPARAWQEHLYELGDTQTELVQDIDACDVKPKMSSPLFGVVDRVVSYLEDETVDDRTELNNAFGNVTRGYDVFTETGGNGFTLEIGYKTEGTIVPEQLKEVEVDITFDEAYDVLKRNTSRPGYILNADELAGVCHFPSKALQHPRLLTQEAGIAKAPVEYTMAGLQIGINIVHNREQEVYIPTDIRRRHTYVAGITGMGKTTLLTNMIKQDIDAGNGVGVIDISGNWTKQILSLIPEHRLDDVILFDPIDIEYPIGFNMLQVANETEADRVREDVLLTIERLSRTPWTDQMDYLFNETLALLLADTQPHTLLELTQVINDEGFRADVLSRVDNPQIQDFWDKIFPSITSATNLAVNRRLSDVFRDRKVRDIFGQRDSTINFRKMMDTKKIFIANLPRGEMPTTYMMFGKVLVSKFQLAALSRIGVDNPIPFYLYIDEFQHFVGEAFGEIIAEARQYGLSLTISHQHTGQLPEHIRRAVGIVGTIISFQLDVPDARAISPQMGPFEMEDILCLWGQK
ncbi:type IV secretion system DNA-binding domain-containing protein, partial [Candidatus Poribacteria bacterium]